MHEMRPSKLLFNYTTARKNGIGQDVDRSVVTCVVLIFDTVEARYNTIKCLLNIIHTPTRCHEIEGCVIWHDVVGSDADRHDGLGKDVKLLDNIVTDEMS